MYVCVLFDQFLYFLRYSYVCFVRGYEKKTKCMYVCVLFDQFLYFLRYSYVCFVRGYEKKTKYVNTYE